MWVLLYKHGLELYNNSHTLSTLINLYEIPHILYIKRSHLCHIYITQ